MRIAIDVMGGDFAPGATTQGAIKACNELSSDVQLVLIGDKGRIESIIQSEDFDISRIEIIHCDEVIEMGDNPFKSFTQKPDSSIVTGFKLLKSGKIDGFTSAGNTGAMLIGSMQVVKSIPGVIRPCITVPLPNLGETPTILVDAGLNPDGKPDVLYQYAVLGSIYAQYIFGIKNPKVGLLNIGKEEEKGSLLIKSTYQIMTGAEDFNFVGNIEGNEIFHSDIAEVIVCDGFVGNVILKMVEAFYTLIKQKNINNNYFERFNPEIYGGTPVLGINAPVIIGHGNSSVNAVKNMILQTKEYVETKLCEKIKEAFNND